MDKQEQAVQLIGTLKAFGVKQIDIAKRVDVDRTYVTKLLFPDKYPTHAASTNLLSSLENEVRKVCLEHIMKILPYLPMRVLDTCDFGLKDLNNELKNEICSVIRHSIANSLDPTPELIPLPEHIDAVLVSLGEDLYVLKLDPDKKRSEQLRLMEHEIHHMVLRAEAEEKSEEEDIPDDSDQDSGDADFGRLI